MVHISCTWQNNDSSSSPTVITCNCSTAIYWGRGGTPGVSARETVIGKGVFWEPLLTQWQKERTGESWSPRTFHRQSGERAASSPWPRGKTDRGDVSRVWVKERGGSASPQERNHSLPCWQHTARCADPTVLTGMCKEQAFPEPTKHGGNTAHQLLIRLNAGPGR